MQQGADPDEDGENSDKEASNDTAFLPLNNQSDLPESVMNMTNKLEKHIMEQQETKR